jgi:hypothetical protein
MKINLHQHKLGFLLFSLGVLVGLVFAGLATWADFEASNYDLSLSADTPLSSLRCPVVLSPGERGIIRASFSNSTENKLTRRIRVYVSRKHQTLMEEEFVTLPLAPGETKTLAWPMDSENIVWNRMILARVYQHRNQPLPSRSSSCGVIVANVFGLPGHWVTRSAITGSTLFMLGGFLFWKRDPRPVNAAAASVSDRELSMKALAAVTGASIGTALLGQWMLGAILIVVATLLAITIVGHFSAL